ncbi:MAG: GGDEF domain-containing protein [Arcobacteraceae bacterium]
MKDKLRILLDKVQYNFKSAESENEKKLDELYHIYKLTGKNFNIDKTAEILNEDVKFGRYQIFLINKNNIVEHASYKADIGLDLGKFKYIEELFQSIFDKKTNINVSVPILDTFSMNLKKYLIRLSNDDKYIIQLAFVIDFKDILQEIHQNNVRIAKNINIYFATQFSFQKVEFGKFHKKKYNLIESLKDTKTFFSTINKSLFNENIEKLINLDTQKEAVNYNKAILTIFKDKNTLLYFADNQEELFHYYSITNGIFNIQDEFQIIISFDYSMDDLNTDIDNIFSNLVQMICLVSFILVCSYIFILLNISNKLILLNTNIMSNNSIHSNHAMVKEVFELTKSYNQLHSDLNKQIKINKDLSYLDSLTHTKNRKAYDEKILELLSLFRRYQTQFSIAMLDIDDFKDINDQYGHKVGDDVLIEMTQLIHENIRESDFLFRIGGEEFILIYSQTILPNALQITEKIRNLIEKNLTTIDNKTITVSIGLTEVENNDTEDFLYQRVDKFLYESKNSGKNRITSGMTPIL